MSVKLISFSQPTEFIGEELPDAQDLIAFCARVSNPKNQFNKATSAKLVQYLVEHKHWSPLEMVNACLEITTTRDIARQILRHRSFSFQEFSQRYADPTKELNFVLRETRMQDPKNRQNSLDNHDSGLDAQWKLYQNMVISSAEKAYKWAIDNGIAKEQARAVLPEGNTESKLYMNGSLRSWVHFIELRTAPGTQREHQEIAVECARALTDIFPLIEDFVS